MDNANLSGRPGGDMGHWQQEQHLHTCDSNTLTTCGRPLLAAAGSKHSCRPSLRCCGEPWPLSSVFTSTSTRKDLAGLRAVLPPDSPTKQSCWASSCSNATTAAHTPPCAMAARPLQAASGTRWWTQGV
eukprot:351934-Chlamydomonas_euryale.AAC.15